MTNRTPSKFQIESVTLPYYRETGQQVMVTAKITDADGLIELDIHMGGGGANGRGRERLSPIPRTMKKGMEFPLKAREKFNFACIGASEPFYNKDGDLCVRHMGRTYKERVLEESGTPGKSKYMAQAVKFSRGAAKDGSEDEFAETSGEFKYITLVMFRGAGNGSPMMQLSEAEYEQQQKRLQAARDRQQNRAG